MKKRMVIIGLTGGIGMGKSTVAGLLQDMGLPIYSADQAVHDVLKKDGKGVKPVATLCPESLKRGGIDRKVLGQAVFAQPQKLRALEKIIHPLLRQAERATIAKARKDKARAVILEIPLLFETGGEARCDITLCVTAPRKIQQERVLSRPNMTPEKFRAILKRQMTNAEKRQHADYMIPTGDGLAKTRTHLRQLLKRLELVD